MPAYAMIFPKEHKYPAKPQVRESEVCRFLGSACVPQAVLGVSPRTPDYSKLQWQVLGLLSYLL